MSIQRNFFFIFVLISGFSISPSPTKLTHFKATCVQSYNLTVTAYTSHPLLTDSTPWLTATLTRTRVERVKGVNWHVVALSRDLLEKVPYGSKVLFRCPDRLYYGLVEDTMNRRWTQRADIWFPSLRQAREFGVKKCVMEVICLQNTN